MKRDNAVTCRNCIWIDCDPIFPAVGGLCTCPERDQDPFVNVKSKRVCRYHRIQGA